MLMWPRWLLADELDVDLARIVGIKFNQFFVIWQLLKLKCSVVALLKTNVVAECAYIALELFPKQQTKECRLLLVLSLAYGRRMPPER